MSGKPRILVVDDEAAIRTVLEARLTGGGYEPVAVASAEEALAKLNAEEFDLVLSDVKMPGMGGERLLAELRKTKPDLPVVLLTAHGSIPDAVAAVKTGAADYLTKPFDGRKLLETLGRVLFEAHNPDPAASTPKSPPRTPDQAPPPVIDGAPGPQAEERPAHKSSRPSEPAGVVFGPGMAELVERVGKAALSDLTVLILGESGSGKEMVAKMLHDRSKRAKGPFVVVDCGSTQATLLESELFGHVKGSFTHAVRDKRGLIEEAHGGTLFLDEIGNISPEMQTRLLRFLQERTIRRLGDVKEAAVDCRVLAATNADLKALTAKGSFREDLYFRLKGVTIRLPPLRERKEDVPALAARFLADINAAQGGSVRLSPAAVRALAAYDWPGNVRELKSVIEAAAVLCRGQVVEPDDLQFETDQASPAQAFAFTADATGFSEPAPQTAKAESGDEFTLDASEHQAIVKALKRSNWVQKDAAELLGISRRAIHYKVKKYGISLPGRPKRNDPA